MTLSQAYTYPVNPPNSSPKLTVSQVYAGLVIKARDAKKFVPAINSTKVIEEYPVDGGERGEGGRFTKLKGLKREVVMGERKFEELVWFFEESQVQFEMQDTGGRVVNVISQGPSTPNNQSTTTEPEIYLTFSFIFPEQESTEANRKKLDEGAGKAVPTTIERIRELVRNGEL